MYMYAVYNVHAHVHVCCMQCTLYMYMRAVCNVHVHVYVCCIQCTCVHVLVIMFTLVVQWVVYTHIMC